MKTKVLLVSPSYSKPYSYSKEPEADHAPLGIGYIAAYLLQQNPQIEVKVLDFAVDKFSPEQWRQELRDFAPEVVGISVLTLGYSQGMHLARLTKEFSPNTLTVAGGPHATAKPEQCLRYCDFVVRGEGEQTLYEIIQGHELEAIKGISYWKNGEIVHNKPRERIQELDNLPFPAHHLFNMQGYRVFPGWEIIGSRGCPYNCIFCGSPQMWGQIIKFRSPQNMVDEIECLHREFGARHIVFQDDTVNIPQQRAFEICNEIIKRGLHKKVSFESQVRANRACVSLELFQKMKEANFVDISFGVESGSDKVLRALQKSLTVDETRQAIRMARQAGIDTVTGFCMVGNWGETIWDVAKTWYFVFSNKISIKPTICTALPGTELESMLRQHGYMTDEINCDNFSLVTPIARTNKMPKWCISLVYYLTVLFVHLPSSLLWGKKTKTRNLLLHIVVYAWGRSEKTRGQIYNIMNYRANKLRSIFKFPKETKNERNARL